MAKPMKKKVLLLLPTTASLVHHHVVVIAAILFVITTSSCPIVFSDAAEILLRGGGGGNNHNSHIIVSGSNPLSIDDDDDDEEEDEEEKSSREAVHDVRATNLNHQHRRKVTTKNLFVDTHSKRSISSSNHSGGRDSNRNIIHSRHTSPAKQSRIIGGSATGATEFAFVVSLQDQYGHFCGGTLIAPNMVLTAAHCLGGTYDVILGRHKLSSNEGQSIPMSREFSHPNYNAFKSDNDFGIIVLSESSASNTIPLLRLNPASSYPSVGSTVTVAGYGDTTQSDFTTSLPESLMKVNVNVISNADCEDSADLFDNYYNKVTSNMLCASVNLGGKDACQGDSGGPLVARYGNGYIQVGIVSWGIGCATAEFPGVYSRISSAYEWIRGKVCEYSAEPKPLSFNCPGSGSSGGGGGGGGGSSQGNSGGNSSGGGSGSPSTGSSSSWSTVFDSDFTNGVTPFIDGGLNAQRLDEAKFRDGIIHLQNQGEMRTQNYDVRSYTKCRTNLDFMMIRLDFNDEWCVEYSANNGNTFTPIQCYNTKVFEAKKWWDGQRATFSVVDVNSIQLRLKSKGDSRQDDVLISSAKLQCRK